MKPVLPCAVRRRPGREGEGRGALSQAVTRPIAGLVDGSFFLYERTDENGCFALSYV
jgi:hypothetical protein